MGFYLAIPVLGLVAALQSSVLADLRLVSGRPDFVLLLIVAWGIRGRLEEGIFWAFVGGIIQDLLSVQPLGISVVVPLIIVFIANGIARQLYQVNLLLILGLTIAATIGQQIMRGIGLMLVGLTPDWIDIIRYALLPTLALHLVLILPVYALVRGVQNRIGSSARAS